MKENSFYHSYSRLGSDGGLTQERHLLFEEQKLCRARARKFSLETNRRRKALDERQKQWDIQEQRLRQNILQRRKQQIQDATERFQRAHLPPSQRYRQSFRRNGPNIEDALAQIQGKLSSYSRQSSVLFSNSHVSRSCTPSPKPPTVSKCSHRQALSAVEDYTKLLQEQTMTCFRNSQQTEKIREKQQDHSPQDHHLSNCCYSESLSIKDSLENEDPHQSTTNLQCSHSSILFDAEESHQDLSKQNDLYLKSDLTSFSAIMLLGDNLPRSGKQNEPKQKQKQDSEGPNNMLYTSKDFWGFISVDQTPKTEAQPLHDHNVLSLCEIVSADPEHFEKNLPQNSPNDSITIANGVAPGILQSSCLKQEALFDLRQQRVYDDTQLKHPSATEILLPGKEGNSKDIFFEVHPKPNILLNDITADNPSEEGSQAEKNIHYLLSQKGASASINNLNKVSSSEPKTDNPINTASLQHACLSNIQSLKWLKCPEEEVQKLPVSVVSSHSACEVRFIKGILKKSKSMSGDNTCGSGSGHLIFAKQVALAIRDSVELTRGKNWKVESNNIVKKLRWFDEVDVEKEDNKQDMIKQKNKSPNLCQSSNNSEDHQLSPTTVSGASRGLGSSMTPPASTGYPFTKQAWADVGVQVSLPQEQADEVKVPWSSTRTDGPKVPWRERPARAGEGPVSSRTRKGTVVRPQSATEVYQIAKTQGKVMVPRPPPRMESVEEKTTYITKTPHGMDHPSVSCNQALALEQTLHKDNSEDSFSSDSHHVIRTDVMYTPLPPSYNCPVSEGTSNGSLRSGHQEPQTCNQRRGMMHNKKGLCLNSTPTDEEISQLWHGVRNALTTKDVKRRQSLVVRKPCVEQSRQPSGSRNRRFPQPSQPTKQIAVPVRPFSRTYNKTYPDEGLESPAQVNLAEVHAEGPLQEREIVAAVEIGQTQKPGTVQQHRQHQGFTTISLEEQRILLSLDRLNHQLYGVQGHVGVNTDMRGSTMKEQVTNHHKQRASSASNHTQYQRRV